MTIVSNKKLTYTHTKMIRKRTGNKYELYQTQGSFIDLVDSASNFW